MANSSKSKSAKKRVKVKELPKQKRKLSTREMKKLKGGVIMANTEGDFHFKNKKSAVDIGAVE